MGYLETIHSPADLKALPESALPELAQEIRTTLVDTLSEENPSSVGGHLGPNLGVVELTIALHRVFTTPADKILFDVSHQAYVHKMLTGRRERLNTIRQYQGLNGFLLRTESEHDCYGAGHAGTALSAALGMAAGRDRRGSDESIICVAGDAAFTCGVSYEALNNVPPSGLSSSSTTTSGASPRMSAPSPTTLTRSPPIPPIFGCTKKRRRSSSVWAGRPPATWARKWRRDSKISSFRA